MADELPPIGHVHKPTSEPGRAFDMGLLDALGELCCLLIAKGVLTPSELQSVMENRAQICRTDWSTMQALPAQTLAEVAAILGKPRGQAFPRDAEVIPFIRPAVTPDSTEPDRGE